MKDIYKNEIDRIRKMHRSGGSGIQVALALTASMDELLKKMFDSLESEKQHLALIALGGYGRKELCFHSDIDVMFLIENDVQSTSSISAVQEFFHKLTNLGIVIGHSYRTIGECLSIFEEDFKTQISLLETRYICGNLNTYKLLLEKLNEQIKDSEHKIFVKNLIDTNVIRHLKYGNSAKLLEPNIKNSSGGLRDIQSAFWLLRGTNLMCMPDELKPDETIIIRFLNSNYLKKQFNSSFLNNVHLAFDKLLNIRNEMHLQSKSLHDTLEFVFQRQIASNLRYKAKCKRTKVELFMQDYYKASKCIAMFCEHIFRWANDKWLRNEYSSVTEEKKGKFIIRDKLIFLSGNRRALNNKLILEAFLIRNDLRAEFSFSFQDLIHRSLDKLKPIKNKIEADLFKTLLHRPNGVGDSLRKMNELGLLEKWIPEWKPMVSFFQHNQYHYYTADEHTMVAILNAEELDNSESTFAKVYRSLPRRDILYLACLMHDIAKPFHIGKHEIKGTVIAKRILRRLKYSDVIDDVALLIRHHLLMEQIAFRRNLNDPQTIADFAHFFQRVEQLDYLYVLTYADLSAVNKSVLTEWKELLLYELYQKARLVIKKKMTSEEIKQRNLLQFENYKEEAFRYLVPEFPPEEVIEHLSLLKDTSYLSTFNTIEIETHLRIIRRKEPVNAIFQHYDNYTDITFISYDKPGVLSKLCGTLTANDVNILDAQVFTRSDGIVIDKFRTVEFISKKPVSEQVCNKIIADAKDIITGRIDVSKLIEKHQMKWKRRTKPLNPNIRFDVEFEEHAQYTIIDIYAPDMLGFLYRVTEKISKLDLNIVFAKIATRVDGIIDSFYVLDNEGKKIDDSKKMEYIKNEILTLIQNLCTSQLVYSSF